MTSGQALLARALAVGYDPRSVVDAIELAVAPGGSLALVGSNGSGKSTLLKTIVGLLRPVRGELRVLGVAPGDSPGRLAYLAQYHRSGFALPLRARDVVRMARYRPDHLVRRLAGEDRRLIDEGLERMSISDLADVPMRELSGGQQQRVHLAQVLARRADLLVLDEPTAGLDAAARDRFLQAMADEVGRGAAVITATHDVGEAAVCDDVVLLAGRVVAHGPPREVLTPEHLLATFGVSLTRIGDHLVATEHAHEHHAEAEDGHDHDPPHGHASRR